MAETEKNIEVMEQDAVKEVSEANAANPMADAPKKNAVEAEASKIMSMADYEDLGKAVTKPTDSNPDASKKTKQVSGDPQQKSQGSADATPKLKEEETKDESDKEEVKEGEMPKAALDALKKKQEKEEGYGMKAKKEMSHEDEKKKDMKEDTIDVSADVDALVGDADLSEEFKEKAATIFETAIKAKVKEEQAKLEEEYKAKLDENTESFKAELTEKVDSYLNYVVEEWMKENNLAIERGIKGEIAEDFISGLKKLFEDHYIDVPDEKYNVLEDQANKIEELEKKLNESIEDTVKLKSENNVLTRKDIIDEVSSGLVDTDKEKFNKLAEEVDYSNAGEFRSKVETIKESYFGSKKISSNNNIDEVAAGGETENVDLSKAMAAYTAAISKTKDVKAS